MRGYSTLRYEYHIQRMCEHPLVNMLILGVEPSQWTYKDHMRTDTLYELVLISKQKIIYYYNFKFAYVIIYNFYLYPF